MYLRMFRRFFASTIAFVRQLCATGQTSPQDTCALRLITTMVISIIMDIDTTDNASKYIRFLFGDSLTPP